MNKQDLQQIDKLLQKRLQEQDKRSEKKFATKIDLKNLYKLIKEDINSLEVSMFTTMKKSEESLNKRITQIEGQVPA